MRSVVLAESILLALANGADILSLNRFGGTALIPACERGHAGSVEALLAAGMAVDHVNRLGWTCLLEAIILGDGGAAHRTIVRRVVEAGADVNLADRDGTTPLGHALQRGFAEIAAILRAKGADRRDRPILKDRRRRRRPRLTNDSLPLFIDRCHAPDHVGRPASPASRVPSSCVSSRASTAAFCSSPSFR